MLGEEKPMRGHTVWFHLHGMSSVDEFVETEHRLAVQGLTGAEGKTFSSDGHALQPLTDRGTG